MQHTPWSTQKQGTSAHIVAFAEVIKCSALCLNLVRLLLDVAIAAVSSKLAKQSDSIATATPRGD